MSSSSTERRPLIGTASLINANGFQTKLKELNKKLLKSVFIIFTILSFWLILTYQSGELSKSFNFHESKNVKANTSKIKINEDICLHPDIDFFDPEIMEFYKNYSKPSCKVELRNLTFLDKSLLINNWPSLYDCWGRCQNYKTNRITETGQWFHTNETFIFNCDFVETRCSNKQEIVSNAVYFYIHSQIIEVPQKKLKLNITGKQYDVYFIVVDSLSYSQMYRNLNKTNKFLLENLEGIPFPYVNRVGLTSRPNGFAWFYGKLTETINRTMYGLPPFEPEPNWTYPKSCGRKLDNEKIIMSEFRDYGYMTAHVPDWIRTIDYGCMGSDSMITHHSYTPYNNVYNANPDLYTYLEKKQCLQRHEHAIDYFDKFVNSYPGKPKMGFMWLSWVGHNDEPGSSDADLNFLKLFQKNEKIFEDSFVFFAGDHGLRFSQAAKTKVGMYDVNNPMLLMTLPKDLRKSSKLFEIVKKNAGELQTHFDTRATLLDILKYQPSCNFSDNSLKTISHELGHSFFRQQPNPRTCKTLPIPPELCICDPLMKIDILSKNMSRATFIGQKVIDKINQQLENNNAVEKCRRWNFERVFFGGKDDISVDIEFVDRLDMYGEKGDCVEKRLRPICDCFQK